MRYIEYIMENISKIPDQVVLDDDNCSKGITYGQVGTISGKVYNYLKSNGVGKEDFVMLCLPRGVQPIIALVGVWRAGAAFVIVEDNYAPERIEFIKNDCGCKLVIDSKAWDEIQKYDSIDGCEETDLHQAAYAVYTSGTTGNPKGVVHEYGNIDRMLESLELQSGEKLATTDDHFALVAPLNFVASMLIIVYGLRYGIYLYVVAYSTIKNPLAIGMFIITNKITGIFLTPSYIRKLTKKPPMLRFCIIGSEPANDVWLDGMKIHNFYLMSESGFAVAHFELDHIYEKTPVGKSEFGHEILLLDEAGNPVPEGEEGEVCFENKFVRGYRNLPEETARVFRDGLYHTGDLAYKNEDGNMVICGRLNDMVKINGNRVEPGEIEGVAKKVLGVDFTAARIFDDGNKVFIAVYYTAKINVDFETTRKAMEQYLPYYMLPSFFIHIDEVPLRPNGKMDRKALPKPDFSTYQDDYVEPRDDIEKRLCDAFTEVLKMDRVGINDDFYQLGGDSLGAMDVLAKSNIHGLNASDIFAGHTPAKIAEIWKEAHPDGEGEADDVLDEKAIAKAHPLTPFQIYMYDYQLYTPLSTMLNLFTMLKCDAKNFEPEKMAKALETAINAHPSLLTKFFFNEDGDLMQKYEPEFAPHIEVEHMTKAEFITWKDSLVRPFALMNSKLYRVRLFEVEGTVYVFFDVHHTVFDGTSFKVMLQDIAKAYYEQDLDHDYYYLMLSEQEALIGSPRYEKAREYFEANYSGNKYCGRPNVDHETRENGLAHMAAPLSANEEGLQKLEKKYGIGRNAFFNVVTMMSIALYNRKPDIQISWTYNGRDDLKKMASTGLLLKDLPVKLELTKNRLISDIYKDVQAQVANGIANSFYPYTMLEVSVAEDDMVCFLYQQDIREGGNMGDMGIETVDIRQNGAAAENVLDVQVLDGSEGLGLLMDYSSTRYDESSMELFRNIFIATTETLIALAEEDDASVKKVVKAVNNLTKRRQWFLNWL